MMNKANTAGDLHLQVLSTKAGLIELEQLVLKKKTPIFWPHMFECARYDAASQRTYFLHIHQYATRKYQHLLQGRSTSIWLQWWRDCSKAGGRAYGLAAGDALAVQLEQRIVRRRGVTELDEAVASRDTEPIQQTNKWRHYDAAVHPARERISLVLYDKPVTNQPQSFDTNVMNGL